MLKWGIKEEVWEINMFVVFILSKLIDYSNSRCYNIKWDDNDSFGGICYVANQKKVGLDGKIAIGEEMCIRDRYKPVSIAFFMYERY